MGRFARSDLGVTMGGRFVADGGVGLREVGLVDS